MDIICGRIGESQVVKIISSTCARDDQSFEELIDYYSQTYWAAKPNAAKAIARRLWEKGLIDQPRVRGEDYHNISRGHWLAAELTKGMYKGRRIEEINIFGLRDGQMRQGRSDGKVTHNSGWYNKNGEKLGYGDLAVYDFERIAREIPEGELFIVLSEMDSFWRFAEDIGASGDLTKVSPTEEAPGVDYVIEHAMFIIARGKLYMPRRLFMEGSEVEVFGTRFEVIDRETVKDLVGKVSICT